MLIPDAGNVAGNVNPLEVAATRTANSASTSSRFVAMPKRTDHRIATPPSAANAPCDPGCGKLADPRRNPML